MYGRTHRIHFIGIGGSGMSGIAEVLLNMGYQVSGSDLKAGEVTDRLVARGGRVFIGHAASNVDGAQVVVYSSAVKPDNPELGAAREAGLPIIARADMLAELMRMKYGVAVGGSHGKTTTTSMVAAVLARGGLDPTIVVGGRLHALGANARLGHGRFLVAEADESDGSFLRLAPAVTVITNIDREHLDHYQDLAEIRQAFVYFANRVPFYGVSMLCADDEQVRAILPSVTKRTMLYGTLPRCEVRASDVELQPHGARFTVHAHDAACGTVELRCRGATTCSTRWRPSRSASSSRSASGTSPRRWPRSGASGGASRRAASRGRGARDRRLRPPSDRDRAPRSRPRAGSAAGCWCCSSRTATPARRRCARSSGAASGTPTASGCSTSTPPASRRSRAWAPAPSSSAPARRAERTWSTRPIARRGRRRGRVRGARR